MPLTCPVCSTPTTSVYRAWTGYDVAQCSDCRHQWTLLRGDEALEDLYPPFEQSTGLLANLRRRTFNLFLLDRVRLTRWANPHGRLLDFGCGSGAFAVAAQRAGYEVTGLEPYSLLTEQASQPRLLHGGLERLAGDQRFDVITAWHVVEHVEDPSQLLRELGERLTDHGRLLVCVPNADSWQARLFGGSWFHLDPPRHLHHFTKESLRRTLGSVGLRPVGFRWWVPEYGISGWTQSILNQIPGLENVLYESVKDRSALEDIPPLRRRLLVLASVAAAVPLAAMSVPAHAAAAVARASATLTVAAERS